METPRSVLGRLLGPLCCGLLLFVLMLLDGSASSETYAVDIEVKDASNVTCLYAKWMMNLSITYESNISEYKNKDFTLPKDVKYDGSTCGDETNGPLLAIEFGKGHLWSINFTKTNDTYQGNITIIYNTDDEELFPDAKRKGPITTSANYPVPPIQLDTIFSCNHVDSIKVGNVTNDLWNISLQAFLQNGSLSTKYTHCAQELVAPTAGNTVIATTTIPNATESTTVSTATESTTVSTATESTTVSTTTVSTTTTPATDSITTTTATASTVTTLPPAPPPTVEAEDIPATGNYSVTVGSTACLLANMGLQLNVSKDQTHEIINIHPISTSANGSCGNASAELRLNDNNSTVIHFFFVLNITRSKFYLKGVNITVVRPDNGSLYAANNNLSYWSASLGSSYMCNKEETLVVTEGYRIKTFDLRVQPFAVRGNKYSTAQECSLDDDTILIPIAVGSALIILIVIIVFAYIIGRKKGYAGYQTL